jgi:hypothetical protein
MYELQEGFFGPILLRTSDNASIPPDFRNTDFQTFLRWLQEGNELPGLPAVM